MKDVPEGIFIGPAPGHSDKKKNQMVTSCTPDTENTSFGWLVRSREEKIGIVQQRSAMSFCELARLMGRTKGAYQK
jgi:hypothetical protein